MKKKLVIFAAACAVLLTACSDSKPLDTPQESTAADTNQGITPNSEENSGAETAPEDSEENTTPEESTDPEESGDSTEENGEDTKNADPVQTDKDNLIINKSDYPDYLCGPGGDKISVDDLAEVQYYGVAEGWDFAKCYGFTYLAEPTGIGFNMEENAELFDNESYTFKSAPAASSAQYKRYREGDTICGLTVKEAYAFFSNQSYYKGTHPEGYFSGGTVIFEGALTLTGYLIILVDAEYAVGGEGDVVFIPDNESQILPIINYNYIDEERGVCSDLPEGCYSAGGFIYQSEYPCGACGNISEYDSAMFAAVEHNVPTKVKITADNISMGSNIDWFAGWSMIIEDMEIL